MVDDTEEIDIVQGGTGKEDIAQTSGRDYPAEERGIIGSDKEGTSFLPGYDIASTGVVLTGGGSLLEGL